MQRLEDEIDNGVDNLKIVLECFIGRIGRDINWGLGISGEIFVSIWRRLRRFMFGSKGQIEIRN